MVNENKLLFLEKQFIPLVQTLDFFRAPGWGKMNAQQMIEHVSAFFKISSGKLIFPLATPRELLPKFKEFLMSEKEFRENTKAPLLPEEPLPLQYENIHESINELEQQVKEFFRYFEEDTQKKTMHPAFGELNYEEWIQLHHKHVKHHLKQFGVEI